MSAPSSVPGKHAIRNAAGDSIADTLYAKRAEELNALINDLRALGAQAELNIPRIVVIGNQSAGKSSLIEAITRITVPRGVGTCTRCPMEFRLHNSPSFRCQISLRIEKDGHGHKLSNARESLFGPAMDSKWELEVMLRRAQLAILNPDIPNDNFVNLDLNSRGPTTMGLSSEHQLQFSPNVICVDVHSPDVTNLSFVDLPGIISNVADGVDRCNIKLIKDLVKEYITGRSLILVVIPTTNDLDNQMAGLLAGDVDPEGIRTIRVLTKPDRLEEGEHEQWLGHLAEKKHDYYVTRQANTAELKAKSTHDVNREREKSFFERTSPWCNQDPGMRRRMGIPNLTARLSTLLIDLIEEALPKLREGARASLRVTLKEMEGLPPPPPENPVIELLSLAKQFTEELLCSVRGFSGHESLIQGCNPAYRDFRDDIASTRPCLVPYCKKEPPEEGETEASQNTVFLEDVHVRILCATTRELPGNTPYRAKVQFIQEFSAKWKDHCHNCLEKVQDAYQTCLDALTKKHYGKYAAGGLYDQVREIVTTEFNRSKELTLQRIDWLLELKQDPFTQDEDYLSGKDEILQGLRRERQLIRLRDDSEEEPEPYLQELDMIAETRAYSRVAYKESKHRIIDNLPQLIDIDFIKGFQRGIYMALIVGFHLDQPDKEKMRQLFSEDPGIMSRRKYLEMRREVQEKIVAKLK